MKFLKGGDPRKVRQSLQIQSLVVYKLLNLEGTLQLIYDFFVFLPNFEVLLKSNGKPYLI